MPGREPDDWGIPLWDAIERWTPRELWERYRELAEYDIQLMIPGRDDPRSEEARSLRARISEILIDRLLRGELIASGIAVPLKETSRRRNICRELWPRLAFSWRFQLVRGNGLTYDQVLIREASSVPHEAPARRQDARRPQVSPRRARRPPGRPSMMPKIEAEMRRRATLGLIERSLRREAEVLAAWAEQEFAGLHIPKPKSIEKALGRIYREVNPTKSPDKQGDKI